MTCRPRRAARLLPVLLATACLAEGEGLVLETTVAVSLEHTEATDHDLTVALVAPRADPPAPAGVVRLSTARLATPTVIPRPCDGTAAWTPPSRAPRPGPLDWLLPTAHAHGGDTADPFGAGLPAWDLLLDPEPALTLALPVPPGRWCALELTFAPAEGVRLPLEATSVPGAPTFLETLRLAGTDPEGAPFQVALDQPITAIVPLPSPATLSRRDRQATVGVELPLHAWLAEAPWGDEAALAEHLATALSDSAAIR